MIDRQVVARLVLDIIGSLSKSYDAAATASSDDDLIRTFDEIEGVLMRGAISSSHLRASLIPGSGGVLKPAKENE